MKILVTGVGGQLGYDVCRVLADRGVEHHGVDIGNFDITDPRATHDYIAVYRPDAVIHCSAWTAVDRAEDEPEKCRAVNVDGTRNIAAACKEIGAKMLYISTDYVFPGTGERFYEPEDPTGPLGVYGETKLAGELVVREMLEQYFIVRTSWMFGIHGQNFVKAILHRAETQSNLQVVSDQFGSPTYARDLAKLLCDMVQTERYGVYHAVGGGVCSWAEFAKEILLCAGMQRRVVEISAKEYPSLAKRPRNSRMSTESLTKGGFEKLPPWEDALRRYFWEKEASK